MTRNKRMSKCIMEYSHNGVLDSIEKQINSLHINTDESRKYTVIGKRQVTEEYILSGSINRKYKEMGKLKQCEV